jgi:hypothetical protein
MSDSVGNGSGLASRRTVIGAAIWSVPVIALVTATPAFAASSVNLSALTPRIASLRKIRSRGKTVALGMGAWLTYRSSSSQAPNVLPFVWTLTASGPTGTHTVSSGSSNITKNGTWSKSGISYPAPAGTMPAGTYTFTLTITVAGSGSKSTTGQIRV